MGGSKKALREREAAMEGLQFGKEAGIPGVSAELRGDRAFMLDAVWHFGAAFPYASVELRADRAFVLAAVRKRGEALRYASDEQRSDRAIVLEVVRRHGWAMSYASDELRADRAFMLDAVLQNGDALRYASDELRGERAFVLDAVRQSGSSRALRFASDELRSDRAVVLEAMRQSDAVLSGASRELRYDGWLQPAAARANPFAMHGALAPVACISRLGSSPGSLAFRASLGMSGREVEGALPPEASLGDLGRELLKQMEGDSCYLHLILLDAKEAIDPLDADKPLRSFIPLDSGAAASARP